MSQKFYSKWLHIYEMYIYMCISGYLYMYVYEMKWMLLTYFQIIVLKSNQMIYKKYMIHKTNRKY